MAIASLVVVLLLCAAGLAALTMQVRCIDSAREAARLAARGDQRAAATPAPGGAAIELRRDGDYMVARVSARSPLLPGVVIVGQAVAAVEPGG
nr:TadE family type IV pilus minor pilin [Mycolicibacterium sp.]